MRSVRFGWMAALFLLGVSRIAANERVPTWADDIAPIIYRHCVECHRPGGVAPFSLLNYVDAAKRARFIARVVESRIMPPWLPSGPRDTFKGERHLESGEIARLAVWAAAGAPEGDLSRAPEPPLPVAEAWQLGPPDVIVKMPRAYEVPPGPGDVYRSFVVPLRADQIPAVVQQRARIPDSDILGVAAIEIHPGNRRVLHHAHVWVDTSGEARRREAAAIDGSGYEAFGSPGFEPDEYLGGYVPGFTPRRLPPGIAMRYQLGGDLVFQIHYSPTGRPETDQTEVGIYFTTEPIKRTLAWLRLGSFNLEIPAGEANYERRDELEIPADCFVLSVSPHMHLLGREVAATYTRPDGTQHELLTIPRWNFSWQDQYTFEQPLFLPRGTRVSVRWIFDNSAANPYNPHSPPRAAHFGPSTTDEMCEFHLFVVPTDLEAYPAFAELMARKMREKVDELTPEQRYRYGFTGMSLGQ